MPDLQPAAFDPVEIFRVLDDHDVDYVLIGGVAARLHGSPTLTEDIDLTPNPTRDNLGRLAAALATLDARLAAPDVGDGRAIPLDADTFSSPVMTFSTRLGQVDVVRLPAGFTSHEDLASGAVAFEVAGVGVRGPGSTTSSRRRWPLTGPRTVSTSTCCGNSPRRSSDRAARPRMVPTSEPGARSALRGPTDC